MKSFDIRRPAQLFLESSSEKLLENTIHKSA